MSAFKTTCILLAMIASSSTVLAQDKPETRQAPSTKVLTKEQWKQLDESVEKGLQWLATRQQKDGSFEATDMGQPAVTSLCVMAFLAQGESPVDGKYQQELTRAINFIADQQKPNGLIALNAPGKVPISRDAVETESSATPGQLRPHAVGTTAVYNHAISSLALCEAYGQCNSAQAAKVSPVIERAIAATLQMQRWAKEKPDVGGWRYLYVKFPEDSDLSITGWQLMFLRSARNAGFEVPAKSIDAAVKFVERCYLEDEDRKVHSYMVGREPNDAREARDTCSRAAAGAGILALAHAGKHSSKEAVAGGEWLLKHDFSDYDSEKPIHGVDWLGDRYHYGAVVCTQGMYQLGGKYWEQFFPKLAKAFLANQKKDGSWLTQGRDEIWGGCYTTSLSILSLSVPNQMLPIFQR